MFRFQRQLRIPLGVLIALLLAGVAVAASSPTVIKTSKVQYFGGGSSPTKVTALTNNRGAPIYLFTHDWRTRSRCSAKCLRTFTPVTTKSTVVAKKGSQVNSKLLGWIKISGGKRQVTYNHHPLYTAPNDGSGPAAQYEGCNLFNGAWYLVNPSGRAIKAISCTAYPGQNA
jgi:predicted lipoprotein with Yx(FWY)xxD motif